MMAAHAEDGFNFGSLNYLFDDDDDDDNDIDDRVRVCVDADSIFGILDEDDQNPPPLPNDPFYPSTEGTQECGSAAHVGNHEDPPLPQYYGALSGNSSIETMETPEQLLYTSPLVNGSENGGFQSPYYVDTDCVPSAQDWFGDFNISAEFPNQGLFDGANYDLMVTTGPTKNNVKEAIDNSQYSRSCLENETVLDAQVGDANITTSEVPVFDFFDGKRPESIIQGNGTINAYDSGSSMTTDEASLEPSLWGLMGQLCEKQAVEMRNEEGNALLKGFGSNASQSSEEASLRYFSFGSDSDARSILAPPEAQHIRIYDGTSVHSHIHAIDRKPIDPIKGVLVASESSLSEARNEEEEDDLCIIEDMSQPMPLGQCSTHGKSLVTVRRQTFTPECSAITTTFHHSVSAIRLKPTNERLVLQTLVQDLCQAKSEATPPDGCLAVALLRHQRIALSWMVQKETTSFRCSGGILADDQGLGKTVSTIALILTQRAPSSRTLKETEPRKLRKLETLNLDEDDDNQVRKISVDNAGISSEGRPSGGTLIVCPTSVLRQWAEELCHKVTTNANLSVLVYHGSNRTKDPYELAKFDVVLTTYSIISIEVPRQPVVVKDGNEKLGSDGDGVSVSSSRKRKHPTTSDKKSLKRGMEQPLLESDARPLAKVRWFRVVLDEAQSIKNHKTQVAQACWGLRAKRRWCLSGTPIQNAVDDLYSYFRFLKYEPYSVYKSFCSMVKFPINKNPSSGYRKLQAVLKTIMLRRTKATCLDGKPIVTLPPKSVKLKKVEFSEEERDFYSRLEADSRAQYQAYAASGTVQQNYVNILLLLLRLRQACDHPFLVQGYDSHVVLKSSIHMAKQLPQQQQIFLLNCLEASLAVCHICSDPPEDAVVSTCCHVFCNQCILEHLSGDEHLCPATDCKAQLTASSVFSKTTLRNCLADHSTQGGSYTSSASESSDLDLVESQPAGHFDSSKIKAALELLRSLSKPKVVIEPVAHANHLDKPETPLYALDDKSSNASSGLDNAANSSVKEKAIVFSQWTRMLDLLEARLKESSIQYRRLDGTMSVVARDKAVRDFNNLPEVTVMIMSLKAASLGLNMVAACHVLLLDLWWNPTTEDQAIDRAHRIGQTRPVTVVRLTVKDTVEDRILALQQKKRELVASAFGEDETGSYQTRLTVDDLNYLFMA